MANTGKGKIFAVGDIHGSYDKLTRLMERLPYDPERDTLVFLGDYIDRGPRSKDVINYLYQLRNQVKHLIMLIGNHEYMMLEYQRTGDPSLLPLLRHIGLDATLDSYGADNPQALLEKWTFPDEHLELLEKLLPYWETEDYIFVHAGLEPGVPLEKQEISTLCETRSAFLLEEHDYGKLVIFGHTPFDLPFVTPNRIGIDTGAVYGNLLTALELPGFVFHHA